MPRQPVYEHESALSANQHTISRDDCLLLQFNTLVGSREVTMNPSSHNPFQTTLQQEIQQTPPDSFIWEAQSREPRAPKLKQQRKPRRFSSKEASEAATFVFDGRTGNPVPKRRKTRYCEEKRLKVAETRRRGACRVHREKKIACPENCIYTRKTLDRPQMLGLEEAKLTTANLANNDRSSSFTFPESSQELPMDFFPDLDFSTFEYPELQLSTQLDFDLNPFWNDALGSQSTGSLFGYDLTFQSNPDLFPE